MNRKLPGVIPRKFRSFLIRALTRCSSCLRIIRIRWMNSGVVIPWSTIVEHGVSVRVTDGGVFRLSERCNLGANTRIIVQKGGVAIGEDTFIGHGCTVVARESVQIGARVMIAEYVVIRDQDHRIDAEVSIAESGFIVGAIVIGDEAWLGAKSSVFRNSNIGARAVIGAHALVKGTIPANAVAVGIPAAVLKSRASHIE